MASRFKPTHSQLSIIRELIYDEPFSHLLAETRLSYGALRDDLITLINKGFVEVADSDTSYASPFYDSDNIQDFRFRATKTGLKKIQNHAI